MAGERTMWLVYKPQAKSYRWRRCFSGPTEKSAWEFARREMNSFVDELQKLGWRCSQITVKETDGA